MDELVASAKATPGAMNYASAGVGTATHLSAERFRSSAGIEAAYHSGRVGSPHRGDDRTVDFFFGPVGVVAPRVREGKSLRSW
ncbi:MAG: hypothetical protein IPP85_16500 [Propionivibrio sp.]|nr:hypothetical protein [Propionivibrio sp.]